MRKLMWFAVGFAAACALCAYVFTESSFLYLAALCGVAALVFSFVKRPRSQIAGTILFGIFLGGLWFNLYQGLFLTAPRELDGKTAAAQVEAADYSFDGSYGSIVDCYITVEGKSYKLRLYLEEYITVYPGDTLSGVITFRYAHQGGEEPATYHRGEGVFLLGYGEAMAHTRADTVPLKYFGAQWRRAISHQVEKVFSQKAAPFIQALLIGDDSKLSFTDNISTQLSGIRHIIAVSGLHVTILFMLIYLLTGRNSFLSLLLGIPVLFAFAAVTGFAPSVLRACIMQILIVLADGVNRENDLPTSLAFSVVTLLLINPLTVLSVSFQLSVGAVVGIVAFTGPISRMLYRIKGLPPKASGLKGKLIRGAVRCMASTTGAMIATVPLCAVYFETVSLVGVVTNLLTTWVVSYLFYGAIGLLLLSLIFLPAAQFLSFLVSVPVYFVLGVSRLLSMLPFGNAYLHSGYMTVWLIACYVLFALFLFGKKKRPRLLAFTAAALYVLCCFLSFLEPRVHNVTMTVVDVGQGQCVILQSHSSAYLIDCGGNSDEAAAREALLTMRGMGIYRLDGLILTHYDIDHAGGALLLCQIMDVGTLYLPEKELGNALCDDLCNASRKVRFVTENILLPCGAGTVTIFPETGPRNPGERSMCILFQSEKCDILITGDRDVKGEEELLSQLSPVDVLVAGHHGAQSATGYPLLAVTQPDTVVISVGKHNIHGHPSEALLSRLMALGCRILRTDLQGTITIWG